MVATCARSARRRISIHSWIGSQHATCANASTSKSASSVAVEHAQHVAIELGGDARGVVVRGNEAVDVLDEVGAEQERVAGCETARDLGEELRAFLGREVADRAAEERDDPASAGGDLVEMVFEVADDGVHLDAVVLAGDRRRCAPERLLADVEGNEATQRARAGERVEQQRVFSDVPEPSSTSVSAPVRSAIAPARSARMLRSARVG